MWRISLPPMYWKTEAMTVITIRIMVKMSAPRASRRRLARLASPAASIPALSAGWMTLYLRAFASIFMFMTGPFPGAEFHPLCLNE